MAVTIIDWGEITRLVVGRLEDTFNALNPARLQMLYPGDPDPKQIGAGDLPAVRLIGLGGGDKDRVKHAAARADADIMATLLLFAPPGTSETSLYRVPSLVSEVVKALSMSDILDATPTPVHQISFRKHRFVWDGDSDAQRKLQEVPITVEGTVFRTTGATIVTHDT